MTYMSQSNAQTSFMTVQTFILCVGLVVYAVVYAFTCLVATLGLGIFPGY